MTLKKTPLNITAPQLLSQPFLLLLTSLTCLWWPADLQGFRSFLTKPLTFYSVFNCISFGTAAFCLKRDIPERFKLVCWLSMQGPCCSHCNAGQVYYLLLARATSHLSERCGPLLSLYGAQRPGPCINTRNWHTCCPEQTPPCISCGALSLSDLFVLQVPPRPNHQQVTRWTNSERGRSRG